MNQLCCIHPDFDGATTKRSESKIISGHPYGGTGFLYNKKYAKYIRPMVNFAHERVTAVELRSMNSNIIIINAYFPYFNMRDLTTYMALYSEIVGQVENIMHSNPGYYSL